MWGDSIGLAMYWDNTGVVCTDDCAPEAHVGDHLDATVTLDFVLNGTSYSFDNGLASANSTIYVADRTLER